MAGLTADCTVEKNDFLNYPYITVAAAQNMATVLGDRAHIYMYCMYIHTPII